MKRLFFCIIGIIMFSGLNLQAQTNPCLAYADFRIVVLGSSTAAGAGASSSDSAWVNRYRAYVQSINPNNEVINLAVGGFSSYQIMPTGYVPPSGRPDVDTTHNISRALTYMPDAIIINLPSNDVASGYSLLEQLHNLDTIIGIATAANIPLWISTTQPRNMSIAYMQLQEDMKDSMYVHYSPYVIDFWTGAALPDNSLNPFYDSGDGVHQNDAGHRLMCDRVISCYILDSIFVASTLPDYACSEIRNSPSSVCGDSSTTMEVVLANIGTNDAQDIMLYLEITHSISGITIYDSLPIVNGINSCVCDTQSYVFSTYAKGDYDMLAYVDYGIDTIASNDSVSVQTYSLGHPQVIYVTDDTLCGEGMAILEVGSEIGDHVLWYETASSPTIVGQTGVFTSPYINQTEDWYAEVVRGHQVYVNSLITTDESNVNWNGCMFNLVASDSLFVDSIKVKIHSLGIQGVEVYKRNGSFAGNETNSVAWTLVGRDTVEVMNSTDFTTVSPGMISLLSGDTVGIYIQMMNSSSTLSYRNFGVQKVYSDSMLDIVAGSGVGHDFSAVYYPRVWNGEVFYHYGNRPHGDCKTNRVAATAHVFSNQFSIGNDTIIDILDSISLAGPSGYSSYLWSNSATQQNTVIRGSDLGLGIHYILLYASDTMGCVYSDTLILGVADLVGMAEEDALVRIYPNPFIGHLYLEGVAENAVVSMKNMLGEDVQIHTEGFDGGIKLQTTEELARGVYLVVVEAKNSAAEVFYVVKE
jgi:lysophospholipase L1-like esterase